MNIMFYMIVFAIISTCSFVSLHTYLPLCMPYCLYRLTILTAINAHNHNNSTFNFNVICGFRCLKRGLNTVQIGII